MLYLFYTFFIEEVKPLNNIVDNNLKKTEQLPASLNPLPEYEKQFIPTIDLALHCLNKQNTSFNNYLRRREQQPNYH